MFSVHHLDAIKIFYLFAQKYYTIDMKKIASQICLLLLLCPAVIAQLTLTLDSVEVTATKIPTSINKTGKSITLITQKEIQKMPVSSVDELLRFLPGINLNARQGFGVQSDVGLRGSTFAQVLFVVDNIRFNDPLTAHFNNNIPVALSEIESIEIVRGPAGASFGADAVGGLIHIKTKHYNARQNEDTLLLKGSIGIGQNSYHFSDANLSYQKEKILATASIQTNIAKGEQLVNPNFGTSADSLYNNYFNIRTYSAALTYFLNDAIKITGRTSLDRRDFNAKYFYTRSNFDESTETVNSSWSQLGIQRKHYDQLSELNIGLKSTNDIFVFNPLFPVNEHTTKQLQINANHHYQLSALAKVTGGFMFLNKRIKSSDRGKHSTNAVAIYADALYPVVDNLVANGSLRLEYDSNFKLQLLPQLSLAYNSNQYILRSSIGRAVRAADFTERYVSSQIPNLSAGRNIGNPDLEAEKSWSFEIGGDYYYDETLKGAATFFLRASNNLIDYVLINSKEIDNVNNLMANENYFYASNISKSTTTGLELQVQKQWVVNHSLGIKGQFSYTLLNTSSDDIFTSKYIANHPNHNIGILIDATLPNISLTSSSNFVNRRSDFSELIGAKIKKNYFISNLRLTYDIPFEDFFKAFIKVQNLTNMQYQEILGAQMPSRWWMFGLSLHFGQ